MRLPDDNKDGFVSGGGSSLGNTADKPDDSGLSPAEEAS